MQTRKVHQKDPSVHEKKPEMKRAKVLPDKPTLINTISQVLQHSRNPEKCLQDVLYITRQYFQCDYIFIGEWDSINPILVMTYYDGLPEQMESFLKSLRIMSHELPLTEWILANTNPLFIEDLTTTELIPKDLIEIVDGKSYLGIGLSFNEQRYGVLNLIYRQHRHHFTTIELNEISILAPILAILLQNTKLSNQQNQQGQITDFLVKVSEMLTATLSLEELLNRIVAITCSVLQCNYCITLEWKSEKKQFIPTCIEGIPETNLSMVGSAHLGLKHSLLAQQLYGTREPTLNGNTLETEYLPKSWTSLTQSKTILFVPLISKDQLLGALHIGYSQELYQPTEEDISLIKGIAHHASIALENAGLLEMERKRVREFETIAEIVRILSSVTQSNKLYPALYEQIHRIIPCDTFMIGAYHPDIHKINIDYLIDEGVQFEQQLMDVNDSHLLFEIIQDKKSKLINKTSTNPPTESQQGEHSLLIPIGNTSKESASLIYIPIMIENEVIGILSVQSYTPNQYQEHHVELLETIAHQAGIALENIRHISTQEQYNRRLELIANISTSINSILNLDERLQKIVDLVREVMDVDACIIRELHNEELTLLSCAGINPDQLIKVIPSMQGISKIMIERKEPVMIYDANVDPLVKDLSHPLYDNNQFNFYSYVGVPLILNGEIKGVIGIYSIQKRRAFTKTDADHLQIIADFSAVAIDNARLFVDKEFLTQRLEALVSITEAGLTALSLDELLNTLLARMVSIAKANAGSIMLLDESEQTLSVKSHIGLDKTSSMLQLKVGEGVAGQVVSQMKPIAVPDVDIDERFMNAVIRPEGVKSTLGVPLRIGPKVIGAAHLDFFYKRNFSQWEISLFEVLASRAALAIENAILYRESHRRAESLLLLQEAFSRELSVLDLSELYLSIVKVATGLIGADLAALPLIDKDQKTFTYLSVWGEKGNILAGKTFLLDQGGLCGWVSLHNEPVLIEDLRLDSRIIEELRQKLDVTTAVVVPLICDREIIGGISLFRNGSPFTYFDLQTMILYANQAAMSIKNARLFTQTQEAEERYRNLFEYANDAIYVHDLNGEFLFANEAMLRLTGYTHEELKHKKIHDLILPLNPISMTNYPNTLTIQPQKPALPQPYTLLQKSGTQLTIEISYQTIKVDGKNTPVAIQGIARDITDRKRRENQIMELVEVTRQIRSTLNLDELLDRILMGVEQLLTPKTYSSMSIMLLETDIAIDSSAPILKIKAARGLSPETIATTFDRLGEGISGWVAQKGEALLIQDINHHPVFQKLSKYQIDSKQRDISSAICAPLKVQEKVIGVLNVASYETDTKVLFDEEDLRLIEMMANHVAIAIEKSQLYEDFQSHYIETVRALARAVDAKDSYTHDHSEKTAEYAVAVAREMGLSSRMISDIEIAAVLHDVGKIGIPDSILLKTTRLNHDEYEEMKKHALHGAKILEPIQRLKTVTDLVLLHQEKFDGSGYPQGLKGDEIPLGCRILSVVDAYQAMTTDRVYRKSLTRQQAIDELVKNAGTQFDPVVVDIFLKVLRKV